MDGVWEIGASDEDLAFLERLYTMLYVGEFPDPDERESLSNMQAYLRKKDAGWYGASNYHILALMECGMPVGLSISDYLARANAGVIEFILTDPIHRKHGNGRKLREATEAVLMEDARKTGPRTDGFPFCVVAEMNDPAAQNGVEDNLDPTVRAGIWNRWDYRKLDFRYVQPALSEGQKPVEGLLLLCKPLAAPQTDSIASAQLRLILQEYMRLAMRIDEPETAPEYKAMSAAFGARVALLPLV